MGNVGRKLRQKKKKTNKTITNKQRSSKELNRNSCKTHSLSKQENASGRVTHRMDKRRPTQLVRNCPLPTGLQLAFNNEKGLLRVLKLVPASKINAL